MDVVCGDDCSGCIGNVNDLFIFLVESTLDGLALVFISTKFLNQLIVLIIEHIEGADEQLVIIVMYFMAVGGRYFVFGVEIWNNIPQLDKVYQFQGELTHLKNDPKEYKRNKRHTMKMMMTLLR